MQHTLIIYMLLILLSVGNINSNVYNVRKVKAEPRFLIYPPTAPTRLQFIGGIGIPVEDLYFESVTSGYVLKAEYFLPTKAEEYRPNYLRPQAINRRRSINELTPASASSLFKSINTSHLQQTMLNQPNMQQYHDSNATITTNLWHSNDDAVNDNDDDSNNGRSSTFGDNFKSQQKNASVYRWIVYKGIEMVLNSAKLPGYACILRSICEHATIPLRYDSGMLAEILHIILTPSTSHDEFGHPSDKQYLRAESIGRTTGNCNFEFSECPISPLDRISYIFDMDE